MAVTPGLTGSSQTVGASEEKFFDWDEHGPGTGVLQPSVLMVRCVSTAACTVRIPELHGASGGVAIPIGEREYFRVLHGRISRAFVSGNTAVIDWGPVEVTRAD